MAKEENRTKSELFKEALRLYIDTREARRAVAKRQLFELIDRIQQRTRRKDPAKVRAIVAEAVKSVRRQAARRRPR